MYTVIEKKYIIMSREKVRVLQVDRSGKAAVCFYKLRAAALTSVTEPAPAARLHNNIYSKNMLHVYTIISTLQTLYTSTQ